MPFIRYEPKRLRPDALRVIDQANDILNEYRAQGYDLTLRSLYYKFVGRDLIPNTQAEYKRLGDIINNGRLAGLIDWNHIVDRTRQVRELSHWAAPGDIIKTAAKGFNIDRWHDQSVRIVVMVEKDAVISFFEPVCREFDVPLLSCRGYTSQTELWAMAQRLGGFMVEDQRVLILHFGDHDPSGLDMTRDIRERLSGFLFTDWVIHEFDRFDYMSADELERRLELEHGTQGWDQRLEVRRMALTYDQVTAYNLPPNPAKTSDARFQVYQRQFGDDSWELDALEPAVFDQLVRDAVAAEYDPVMFDAVATEEIEGRRRLALTADKWDDIQTMLDSPQTHGDTTTPTIYG